MQVRLVLLVAVLIVVAGFVLLRKPAETSSSPEAAEPVSDEFVDRDPDGGRFTDSKKLVADTDLPGREPGVPPELHVAVSVDEADGKNRLYFDITETHGYFVESMILHIFWKPEGGGEYDRVMVADFVVNDFLRANSTLSTCTEIVPAELRNVGGKIGSSESWIAEVVFFNRARVQDPDPSWEGYSIVPPDRNAACGR